jgi:hypothetical protein
MEQNHQKRTRNADDPYPTCGLFENNLCRADGPPNLLPQNFGTSKDPRANSQELDEHAMNTERADSPRSTGGQSAGLEQNSPSSKTRSQPLLPIHESPKRLELSLLGIDP